MPLTVQALLIIGKQLLTVSFNTSDSKVGFYVNIFGQDHLTGTP